MGGTAGAQGCLGYGLLPSSRFRRRARSRRWLTMDSVPVSLSIPSRLLATLGLCPQEGVGPGQAAPRMPSQLLARSPTHPPTHPPRWSFSACPSSADQFLLPMGPWSAAPPPDRPGRQHTPQDHPPTVLTGKRGAGNPQCRPSSQEVGAGLCGHQCSETLHPSVHPRPGPAAEESDGSDTPTSLRWPQPPAPTWAHPSPSPHPSLASSANIPRTHPRDHAAVKAGQLGVIIRDFLLHHPVGRHGREATCTGPDGSVELWGKTSPYSRPGCVPAQAVQPHAQVSICVDAPAQHVPFLGTPPCWQALAAIMPRS